MPKTTEQILDERGRTHGDYYDHARYTQCMKDVVRVAVEERISRNQEPLTREQMESVEMILHKVGRILAGNANEVDHWDDIAGYSKLISRALARDELKIIDRRMEQDIATQTFHDIPQHAFNAE